MNGHTRHPTSRPIEIVLPLPDQSDRPRSAIIIIKLRLVSTMSLANRKPVPRVFARATVVLTPIFPFALLLPLLPGCIENKTGGVNQRVLTSLKWAALTEKPDSSFDKAVHLQHRDIVAALVKALEEGPKTEMVSVLANDLVSGKEVRIEVNWIGPQQEATGLYVNGGGLDSPISIPFSAAELSTMATRAGVGVIYSHSQLLPSDSRQVKALRAIANGEAGDVGIQLPNGETRTVREVHWSDYVGGG